MTRGSQTIRTTVGWAALGVGSSLAGLAAQAMGLPAGWLVGPMLVALAFALAWKEHPTIPRWGRTASLAVVGGMLAATFRPSVLSLVASPWVPDCCSRACRTSTGRRLLSGRFLVRPRGCSP